MPGQYPGYHSLVEKLAQKVISRVVHDGLDLGNAVKEAYNYAKLSRQQTIHMCAVLQDYGMQYNGDPKDYFYFPGDLGAGFPNTEQGYVTYANSNSRSVTGAMNRVFKTISELKKQGFSNQEISELNPDLIPILDSMEEVVKDFNQISDDIDRAVPSADQSVPDGQAADSVQIPFESLQRDQSQSEEEGERYLAPAAAFQARRLVVAQEQDVEVEAPTPDNVQNALQDANSDLGGEDVGAEDDADLPPLPGDEDELGGMDQSLDGEDVGGGDVSATVKPSPSDLDERINGAPEWEVENILSIQSAENFYTNMRKDLEAVVFNENITLDQEALKKYDAVRAKIDEQLDKITDAQKETKKLEEKETDLSEEFEVGNDGLEEAPMEDLGGEAPTDELTAEAPEEEFEVAQEPK